MSKEAEDIIKYVFGLPTPEEFEEEIRNHNTLLYSMLVIYRE